MRKKIVAGNWKMNKTVSEAKDLCKELLTCIQQDSIRCDEVILCPPSLYIEQTTEICKNTHSVYVAAQNCHTHDNGAYTGEISAKMIKSCGASYVILGHSERRMYNHETDETLAAKVNAALQHQVRVLFCCGESLDIRNSGKHEEYVCTQIKNSLFHLDENEFKQIVIAYEPIWAIGTGVTATKEQAQEMHAAIRTYIATKYGNTIASNTSILYGGSCNPKNAKELFEQADVDGGLIGGASLSATDFYQIIQSF